MMLHTKYQHSRPIHVFPIQAYVKHNDRLADFSCFPYTSLRKSCDSQTWERSLMCSYVPNIKDLSLVVSGKKIFHVFPI